MLLTASMSVPGKYFQNRGQGAAVAALIPEECQDGLPKAGSDESLLIEAGFATAKTIAILTGCQGRVKKPPLLLGWLARSSFLAPNVPAFGLKNR